MGCLGLIPWQEAPSNMVAAVLRDAGQFAYNPIILFLQFPAALVYYCSASSPSLLGWVNRRIGGCMAKHR
jgi:hypothetical protein